MANETDKKALDEATKALKENSKELERNNELRKEQSKLAGRGMRDKREDTTVTERSARAQAKRNKELEAQIKSSSRMQELTSRLNRDNRKLAEGVGEGNLEFNKFAKTQYGVQNALKAIPTLLKTINSGFAAYNALQYRTIKANNEIYKQFGRMPQNMSQATVQIERMTVAYGELHSASIDIANSLGVKFQEVAKVQEEVRNAFNMDLREYNKDMGDEINHLSKHFLRMQQTVGLGVSEQIARAKEALASSSTGVEDFAKGTEKVVNFSDDLIASTGKLTEAQRHYKVFIRSEMIRAVQDLQAEMEGVVTTQEDIAALYTQSSRVAIKYGFTAKEADKLSKNFTKNVLNQGRANAGLTPAGFLGGQKLASQYNSILKGKGGEDEARKKISGELEATGLKGGDLEARVNDALKVLKQGDFMSFNELMSSTDSGKKANADFPAQLLKQFKGTQFEGILSKAVIPGATGQAGPESLSEARAQRELYADTASGKGSAIDRAIKNREGMRGNTDAQNATAQSISKGANAADALDVAANNALGRLGEAAPSLVKSTADTASGVAELVILGKAAGLGSLLGKAGGAIAATKAGAAATGAISSLVSGGAALGTVGAGAIAGGATAAAGAGLAAGGALAYGADQIETHGEKVARAETTNALTKEIDGYIKQARDGELSEKQAASLIKNLTEQLEEAKKNSGASSMLQSTFNPFSSQTFDSYKHNQSVARSEGDVKGKLKELQDAAAKKAPTPSGSHAAGKFVVPYSNYQAMLHKDEEVVSAQDRRSMSSQLEEVMTSLKGRSGIGSSSQGILQKAVVSGATGGGGNANAGTSSANPFSDMNSLPKQANSGDLRAQAKMTSDNRFILTIADFDRVVSNSISNNARSTATGI